VTVPTLFTRDQLAAYVQHDVNNATSDLLHAMLLDEIGGAFGATAVADPPQSGLLAVSLRAAARAMENPINLRSEMTGSYQATHATESIQGDMLTESEREKVGKILNPDGTAAAYIVDLRDSGSSCYLDPAW
jgi:hypothetical protein